MPFFGGFAQSRAFGRGGAGKLPVFTTTSNLGFLKQGQTASAQLAQVVATVGAGDPPVISYSIVSGSLPAGVTFNSDGTWSGTVGTISSIETRTYTIRVTSAAGFTDGTFTIILETTPTGQAEYTSPGTYTWTAPTAVRSVCVVCVGGGGGSQQTWAYYGGAGGGLGWKNNISVTPGQNYTIQVGSAGAYGSGAGGNSFFVDTSTVSGYGGGNGSSGTNTSGPNSNGYGGGYIGDGGGAGGNSNSWAGGAGAGGYSNSGGNPSENWMSAGGGGGHGGDYYSSTYGTGAGGGVGIYGRGSNGQGCYNPWAGNYGAPNNSYGGGGLGGSGGGRGYYGQSPWSSAPESYNNIIGGTYGGGAGGAGTSYGGGPGGPGAVRIIWGNNRAFPDTNTANQ